MQDTMDIGPVELGYAAAMRGLMPRGAGEPFTYGLLGAHDAEYAVALAACNPEGQFTFFCHLASETAKFESLAAESGVTNVRIVTASVTDFSAQISQGKSSWPAFDYLCVDTSTMLLLPEELNQMLAIVPKAITAQGVFAVRYRPFSRLDDSLGYIVHSFADQVPPGKEKEFLGEISALATRMAGRNRAMGALLEKYTQLGDVQGLKRELRADVPGSKTLDVQQAMLRAGMHYLGDAKIADNYLELAVPSAAQEQLMKLQDAPHFEMFKDLARDRLMRTDVWCKPSAQFSADPSQLFRRFSFGIGPSAALSSVQVGEQKLDLTAAPFRRMIEMMRIMPITLTDCEQDDQQKGIPTQDLVSALQILVATAVAAPMRDSFAGGTLNGQMPRASNRFNLKALALNHQPTAGVPLLASSIIGRPVRMDAKDYLVLKSITQENGFEGSAHVLRMLLEVVAQDPLKALTLLGGRQPTTELATSMIEDVCQRDFAGWYGYGLLAAA